MPTKNMTEHSLQPWDIIDILSYKKKAAENKQELYGYFVSDYKHCWIKSIHSIRLFDKTLLFIYLKRLS